MKMNLLFLAFAAPMLLSCSSDDDDNLGNVPTDIIQPVVNTTA